MSRDLEFWRKYQIADEVGIGGLTLHYTVMECCGRDSRVKFFEDLCSNCQQITQTLFYDEAEIKELEAKLKALPSDEMVRAGVARLKLLCYLRVPEYELPADSFLEQAVLDILNLRSKECHQ